MHRVIGERGLGSASVAPDEARSMLRDMVRARRFDERALALQRRGWMSGYPPFRGQEATQIGAAHAMREDDWLAPTYRQNALQIARGVPMSDLLLFRRGRAEFHSGHGLPHLPQAVPIATQIPHATGIGMAANYRDEDHAVVCCFGDGATSEGDFHEGLNFAGVFDAPVVFLCENNGWAISMPRERQTASDTIAEKARAYGFEGIRVDGNDPLAVHEVLSLSLERARDGEPVLVESLTYRQGPHTTSDDPSRYREEEPDLPEWRTRDPIDRFEAFLREEGALEEGALEAFREEATGEVEDAVERAESVDPADPDDVFDHAFADLPPRLREQHGELRALLDAHEIGELDH